MQQEHNLEQERVIVVVIVIVIVVVVVVVVYYYYSSSSSNKYMFLYCFLLDVYLILIFSSEQMSSPLCAVTDSRYQVPLASSAVRSGRHPFRTSMAMETGTASDSHSQVFKVDCV